MDVKVVLDNKCNAPDADLNKPNDQAMWYSGDNQTSYAIAFYSGPSGSSSPSPFTNGTVFTVMPGVATPSGPIDVGAPKGSYKYRVVGDNGCDIDPKLRIGP